MKRGATKHRQSKGKRRVDTRQMVLVALIFVSLILTSVYALLNPFADALCAHSITDGTVIHVSESGFDPKESTAQTGQKVVFENSGFSDVWPASDDHPTHQKYSALDPKSPILPGETWEFTFEKPGTYTLHDHLMPQNLGSITVSGETVANADCQGSVTKKAKPQLNTTITLPAAPDVSVSEIVAAIKTACANGDSKCQEAELGKVVQQNGPTPALEAYARLLADQYIPPEGDGHQFAHRLGRKTAESFGVGFASFDLCSTEFNYGCQHGYFEYVLGRTDTPKQAIETICSQVGPGKAPKARFYCYHGAGHGVMMAEANDVERSLKACDELAAGEPQAGCWQGVFMENVNAVFRGEAQAGIFDTADPLAPCNKVETKYRTECYQNQAAWIVRNTADVSAATNLCLRADSAHISDCPTSIGLMTTNPGWQDQLLPESTAPLAQKAWMICQKFPNDYTDTCVQAAIANLSNFDELNPARMVDVCRQVSAAYSTLCIKAIGEGLRNNSSSDEQFKTACTTLPSEWQSTACGL